MTRAIQAVRGMNDILPEQTLYWQTIESHCRRLTDQYGYREIRLPIVEQTTLFSRTIGDATDIVEKEMYTFNDRNGDSLSLRPEGTASCVRAGIQHGLFYNQTQRLWYLGPMFRHERPQKGRYRQFHQFGLEAYGMAGPDIDAEVILFSRRLLTELGLSGQIELQINSLATPEVRLLYRQRLIDFYQKHYDLLDEDSQRRILTNPLRILDSKNPLIVDLNLTAPNLLEYLDPISQHHFDGLRRLLDAAEAPYVINPRLVRGLDYYGLTVFEWVTTELGSQGTVCAGGRYDRLVEEIGGKPTPAVGFAIGLERLVLLLSAKQTLQPTPDIYLVLIGAAAVERGMLLAEQLRTALPQRQVLTHLAGGSLKSQLKAADKSQALFAVIIGDDELTTGIALVKDLRSEQGQQKIAFSALFDFFKE